MKNVLNLGILAHVDAGKTSLTERLLYAAGAIAEIGSVDAGSTQTDSLELERQRGITIKSAVVSFVIDDLTINLIDTPGHPDFIAEVERVLNVLDGAVLVVSAVEGVQAQTRVLMRTLRRLCIPVLIFVNKIDRRGAREDALLRSIAEKLTPDALALGGTSALGTPAADFEPFRPGDEQLVSVLIDRLSARDDALLAACLESELDVPFSELWRSLVAQTRKLEAHPLFFGSAITGAGVGALIDGIRQLLPRAEAASDGALSGTVFKIERGAAGAKVAVVRLFSGSLGVRDRVELRGDGEAQVTAIEVFERGSTVRRSLVSAGEIARLWGLDSAQVGDWIGVPTRAAHGQHFAAPTLETIVVPRHAEQQGALHHALSQLAEQDPLINLRRSETHEIAVSLYGEVQKEVIGAMLASDFGIEATFRETTPICVERPLTAGAALELIGKAQNPFWAALGLRIAPAAARSGVDYRLEVEVGVMAVAFFKAIREAVLTALEQGLQGWQVTDCTVTVTHTDFISPLTRAGDFRALAPLVVMSALAQAGTRVCEPMLRYHLEVPADTLEQVLLALGQRRATAQAPTAQGSAVVLEGLIPAAQVHALAQRLPALTHGEGVLEHTFDHHRAIHGDAPSRPRTDHNPLSRKEYLLHVVRRV